MRRFKVKIKIFGITRTVCVVRVSDEVYALVHVVFDDVERLSRGAVYFKEILA